MIMSKACASILFQSEKVQSAWFILLVIHRTKYEGTSHLYEFEYCLKITKPKPNKYKVGKNCHTISGIWQISYSIEGMWDRVQ